MVAVRAVNVSVGYPSSDRAGEPAIILRELTFTIHDCGVVALVGPSGGGKTTLLRLLAGILSPLTGQISLDRTNSPHQRWYSPQQPVLIEFRTALQNVCLSREMRGELTDGDVALAASLLEEVGMRSASRRRPSALSGGMKRRVALAQALFSTSPILLLDEPFAELDTSSRRLSEVALNRRARRGDGITVFATHDVDSATAVADHVIVLAGGETPARQFSIAELFKSGSPPAESRRKDPTFGEVVGEVHRFIIEASGSGT